MSIKVESKISSLVIPKSLEWEGFAPYLKQVNPHGFGDIAFALGIAKSAHQQQFRQSGEPFFSHPLMAAIYLAGAGCKQPHIIAAGLLHDVPEDNLPYLLKAQNRVIKELEIARIPQEELYQLYEEDGCYEEEALLFRHLGSGTVTIIRAVTRARRQSERGYQQQLREGPPGGRLVKAADCLHNLRTLPPSDSARIVRKIAETRQGYIPIFEMAAREFPVEGRVLLDHINIELERLETGRPYSPQF